MATLRQVVPTAPPGRPGPPAIHRVRGRRRPSGEPPPLPRHLNASGRWWLALGGGVLLAWTALRATGHVYLVDVADTRVLQAFARLRSAPLNRAALTVGALATPVAVYALWVANVVVLIVVRRWRHLFVWIGVALVVVNLGALMLRTLQRPRPYEVELIGRWSGYSMPSLPITVLSAFLVSTVYGLVPAGRYRSVAKWVVCALVVLTGLARLFLAQDQPSGIAAGALLGVAVPLAAFRLLTPNDFYPVRYRRGRAAHLDVTGARGEAIVRALQDQLGLLVLDVRPFGLAGSGGSTPLKIKVKAEPGHGEEHSLVFAKLYAATHVRSDRWYKWGRTLLYGRLEDEKPFHGVRRLVQYEDYVLHLFSEAALPVPRPLGIVEITPEREYLLVMEFFDQATEIGEAEIDDSIIDQGLGLIRRMWDIGMAHRDIKPANLLVRDGTLLLIDTAFAEIRPSPWRQAVDLANMMLVLGLRTDAERVYQRARLYFSDEEIAEAFAATRGITMPSQLRRLLRQQGRDLHGEFLRLLPYRLPPVRIQRWSIRRVGLMVITLAGGLVAAGVLVTVLGQPL